MSLSAAILPTGGPVLQPSSLFPDFVVGKSYELAFEPGFFFSQIPEINYPKQIEIGGVRYVFTGEHRDYTNKTFTVKMRLERVDGPVQATIATPIVIGVVALVIGVVTIFMLKEVKEVVAVLPPALTASVGPLILILLIIAAGHYIITKHRA